MHLYCLATGHIGDIQIAIARYGWHGVGAGPTGAVLGARGGVCEGEGCVQSSR